VSEKQEKKIVDLFSTYSKLIRPWISESTSSEEIEKIKHAFESVLAISTFTNNNESFSEFKQKMEDLSSNFLNHSGEILVNSFVANFFDSFYDVSNCFG
jgi:hypothetical protein